jgi:hypothetical protein
MTRIQLSTGFIDLPVNTDFPIDLSFAEITKNGSRSGGFSRSLDVDGSDNNSELLGLLFDIDLTNDTFNRNKKTEAFVIQDGVEVFGGYIQLLEIVRINKVRGTNFRNVKYKITVFDEVSNFFNEMGEKELTELSFPEFSHDFTRSNIIASWSNTEGYTYPQYAKSDNIYTLRDFKPAIYEFEYLKKIFSSNGYSFDFAQWDDLDIRFNQRIIPYNGKQGDDTISQYLKESYTVRGEMLSDNYVLDSTNLPTYPVGWLPTINYLNATSINTYCTNAGSKVVLDTLFQDAENQYNLGTGVLTNKAGQGRIFQILTSYDYSIQAKASDNLAWKAVTTGALSRCEVKLTLVAQSTINPDKVAFIDAGQTVVSYTNGTVNYSAGLSLLGSGNQSSFCNLGIFDALEIFDVHCLVVAKYFNAVGAPEEMEVAMMSLNSTSVLSLSLATEFLGNASGLPVRLDFDINISNLQLKAIPDVTELTYGSNVDVSQFIPKKIKQRDLISAISKSYNLIFSPDPDNDRNIIVKTRDNYYKDGSEWNWTDKFQEAQENSITFLSNDVKNKQVYRYKADKDTINTSYQNEFADTFGQSSIVLDNEYAVGQDNKELLYSPTPSALSGLNVLMPCINGMSPDNNIRVLLHNGLGTANSYAFYDDVLPFAYALAFVTEYNKTSMFDSDLAPDFSLCFDAPKALFHGLQTGQTTNYLYTLHHQQELTTINNGKKLSGYFNLTEVDFQKLSKRLDWKIFIKDNGWFFVSKVHGYNSGKRTLTKVDLITADEKTKIKRVKPAFPIIGNPLQIDVDLNGYYGEVNDSTNIVFGGATTDIKGKYNYVTMPNVKIQGDNNLVLSSDVVIIGNRNIVLTGKTGSKIIGDDLIPSAPGNYFNNTKLTIDNKDGVALEIIQGGVKFYQQTNTANVITLTTNDNIVICDAFTVDINLPTAVGNEGLIYTIKYVGLGVLTINTKGVELIDNELTLLLTKNDSVTIFSSGSEWFVI